MQDFPESVNRYLREFLVEEREPACLEVGRNGDLRSCFGNIEVYGLSNLRIGKQAAEQVALLVGLFQPDGPGTVLPQVQTPSGRHADIHVVPGDDSDWVVFLDIEGEHSLKTAYQQKANELSLLKDRQNKLINPGMPTEDGSEAVLASLMDRLDTMVLNLPDDGSARLFGAPITWFRELCPEFVSGQQISILGERFPFLENFLFDAEIFWQGGTEGRLKSGAWAESMPSGEEIFLEASAARVGRNRLLLIERMGGQYEENRSLLQKARNITLEEQRRVKETQKKEILLHCIVHDLAGPLTGIKGCLSLLKFENLSPKGKELLEAGLRQTTKQEKWIRTILEVFSAEVASLETFSRDPNQAPDAALCAREVVQALLPAASAEKINLQLSSLVDISKAWKVAGERTRLERVLFNLVENALRHTSPASTVTVGLERNGDFVNITVDDEGPGITPEVAGNLFQKFSQGEGHTGKAGLGLYFCRITVERWGGEIGCHSLPDRGARFWFRLPAVES